MTAVSRTSDQPAADRLEYLRQVVAESIVPFDLRPEDETSFSCEIRKDTSLVAARRRGQLVLYQRTAAATALPEAVRSHEQAG